MTDIPDELPESNPSGRERLLAFVGGPLDGISFPLGAVPSDLTEVSFRWLHYPAEIHEIVYHIDAWGSLGVVRSQDQFEQGGVFEAPFDPSRLLRDREQGTITLIYRPAAMSKLWAKIHYLEGEIRRMNCARERKKKPKQQ